MEEVRNVPGSCIEGTEHSCRTPLVLFAFLTDVNGKEIPVISQSKMAQRQFSDVSFECDRERFLSTADNNIHDVRNMDSYDGNRDSDIMKRSRFRNHCYLHGIHEDHTLPIERLVSFTMFDDDTPPETDNGFSMDTHVT